MRAIKTDINMKVMCLLLLLPLTAWAGYLITFSAHNPVTFEQVPLDSIRVQNLTLDRDTMLVQETSFAPLIWTGMDRVDAQPERFSLTPNFPNGFDAYTRFIVALPGTEACRLELFNVLGQRVLSHSYRLAPGKHTFTLNSGSLPYGIYFLRVAGGTQQRVIKMVKSGASQTGDASISYFGAYASAGNAALGKPAQSDIYRFTAHASGYETASVEKEISGAATIPFEMMPVKPPDDFTSNWRGFNLMGFFALEWSSEGFTEEDFQMISEMGFNFVRLPLDYRIYTKTGDWNTFIEFRLAQIDQAVAWGQKYGIHVCINLHRAPGYCVNPPSTPLPANQTLSLWEHAEAQQAFAAHWRKFAERYLSVPTSALSFNLVNEPGNVSGDAYVKAVQPAIEAIRAVSPQRIIISDAVDYGNSRIDALFSENIVISPHFYNPSTLTHYKAEWVNGADAWPPPTWPPQMVSSYFYGSGKSPWNTPLILRGDFAAGSVVTFHVNQVSARADFRVTSGSKTIFQHDFRPAAGTGEWKEVIYRPEWNIYQNIYDREYTFTLVNGVSELNFRVLTGDWMTWSMLRFTPPPQSSQAEITIQPGIADWGVPQATYTLQSDGILVLEQAPRGFEDRFRFNGFLQQWVDLKKSGVPVHVGEWGVYNKTPHDVTLAFMENRLLAMKSAGLGWALWNFRGSFGILDSGREDVRYENYRGHKLDRKMLELLQRY